MIYRKFDRRGGITQACDAKRCPWAWHFSTNLAHCNLKKHLLTNKACPWRKKAKVIRYVAKKRKSLRQILFMTFKVKIFKVSNTYFLVAGGGSTSPGFVYHVALTGLCPILEPKILKSRIFNSIPTWFHENKLWHVISQFDHDEVWMLNMYLLLFLIFFSTAEN